MKNTKNESSELFWYAIAVIAVIALFVFQPFVILWAVNHVFALGLAYTFESWLAITILNWTWMYRSSVQKVKVVKD